MNDFNISLTATVKCGERDCARSFTYSFRLADVRAHIGDGGRIEFDWPLPDLPEGWTDERYENVLCPTCSVLHKRRP